MPDSAKILATEAMAEARAALAEFAATIDRILTEVDADIQRVSQWLQQDRPGHWKQQVRLRQEAVVQAKSNLSRKQLAASPDPPKVVEERKALERAKSRLDEAMRRQEATRKWAAVWEREAMGYKAPAHQIREMVAFKIPSALSRIARMIESIQDYISLAPPPTSIEADGGDLGAGPASEGHP